LVPGGAPAIPVADLVIDEAGQVAQFILPLDRPSAATWRIAPW